MIRFDDVSVVRADGEHAREVLAPFSLELAERRVALVGANGSGKSTLARLVNGLVEATTGTVTVDGTDVARQGREARSRVGFVFTDPAAQLVMPTVIEDVSLSLRKQHRRGRERDLAAREWLTRYGLEGLATRSVHELSGGQQQLLALVTVLAGGPDVVVADEPTTLLDLRNTRIIVDVLLGLEQQLVVATHDLDLATRCERALWIDGGRIAADGSAAEVVARYRASVA